ncbi:MAG: hypothetical protein AB2L10_03195 [Methanospirillum sp.]
MNSLNIFFIKPYIVNFLNKGSILDLSLLIPNVNFIQRGDIDVVYKIYRTTRIYGSLLLFFFIGSLGFLLILRKIIKRSSTRLETHLFFQVVAALIIGLFLLTGDLVIGEMERALAYFILLTPILCGIFFINLLSNHKIPNNYIIIFIFFFVVISSILGIFNLYYSPSNSIPSPMVPYADKSGIEFLLKNKERTIPINYNINEMRLWPYYLFNPILGPNMPQKSTTITLPFHFGYENHNYLGEVFNEKSYLITNERLKKYQFENQRELYTEKDFERLNQDKSVNKIFSSSVFESWLINGDTKS